jgi:hypothetical protein
MKGEKLIKVTFEFENKIQTLEGEAADKWLKSLDNCVMYSTVHNVPMIKSEWNIKPKQQ